MDFINKVKLPISYYAFNDNWDLLDRDDKADIIMIYIDVVNDMYEDNVLNDDIEELALNK